MPVAENVKRYYQLLIEDRANNDRFLSTSLYTESELEKNDSKVLLKKEYFIRHPDEKLLFAHLIDEQLAEMKVISKIEISI